MESDIATIRKFFIEI